MAKLKMIRIKPLTEPTPPVSCQTYFWKVKVWSAKLETGNFKFKT